MLVFMVNLMNEMIRTEDVYYEYIPQGEDEAGVQAVKGVSMSVEQGSFVVVLGRNGSGKSTLARLMNGLLIPGKGTVIVDGIRTDNREMIWEIRKTLGLVFQNPDNQIVATTVEEDVAFGPENLGMPPEEIRVMIDRSLKMVNMEGYGDYAPHMLSGGQKQRVAIARALANNPRVLLSDEATSALDPDATESILQLLEKLNRELGLTIVIITHEMAVIRAICDKVAVMEQGHVVECGDTYRIFSRPRAEITRRFVSSTSGFSQADKLIARRDEILAGKENGAFYLLLFTRDSLSQATVSRISREYGVDLDILLANIELLRGGSIGRMLVAASGNGESIQAALRDLKQYHVEVREVTGYAVD